MLKGLWVLTSTRERRPPVYSARAKRPVFQGPESNFLPLGKPDKRVGALPRFQDRPLEERRQEMGVARLQLVTPLPRVQALPHVASPGERMVEEIPGLLESFLGNPTYVQVEAAGGLLDQGKALAGKPAGYRAQGSQVLDQVSRSADTGTLARQCFLRRVRRVKQRPAGPRFLRVDDRLPLWWAEVVEQPTVAGSRFHGLADPERQQDVVAHPIFVSRRASSRDTSSLTRRCVPLWTISGLTLEVVGYPRGVGRFQDGLFKVLDASVAEGAEIVNRAPELSRYLRCQARHLPCARTPSRPCRCPRPPRSWAGRSPPRHWTLGHGGRAGTRILTYGQPAPGAGARVVRIRPVRSSSAMVSGPRHSLATMNSVLLSVPPSAQAKHPRSSSIV